jgi:hypothetical protein
MSVHHVLQNRLLDAMRAHRQEKLASGQPFMLGADGLPDGQAYYEYPDGEIALVARASLLAHYEVIRFLSDDEAALVRAHFGMGAFGVVEE